MIIKNIFPPQLHHFTNASRRIKADLKNQTMGLPQLLPNQSALIFHQDNRLPVPLNFRHFFLTLL
jgi:hypothetical protein